MEWNRKKIWHAIQISALSILIFLAIGFVNRKQEETVCKNIQVSIEDRYENFFVDEEDIVSMVTNSGQKVLLGKFMDELDLKDLESKVKSESFIKSAQVYRDLKGNVFIKATQRRPIARILFKNSSDQYIAQDGTILPVSRKYTARVVLIRGVNNLKPGQNLYQIEEYAGLMDLLHYIYNDEFWKAQISEIDRQKNGELSMYTQVSKQRVEFGSVEDLEAKFRKLRIFYKEILPRKGWNTYEKVNIKFKDQIICQ